MVKNKKKKVKDQKKTCSGDCDCDCDDNDDETACCDKSSCCGYGHVTSSFMLGICESITLILMWLRDATPAIVFCWIFLCLYIITNDYKGSVTLRKVMLGTYLIQVVMGAVYVACDVYCDIEGISEYYHEVLRTMRWKIEICYILCLPIRFILILFICHRWRKEKHILMQDLNYPQDEKYEIPNTINILVGVVAFQYLFSFNKIK